MKQLIFLDAARTKLQSGINILADAVKMTLGPKGKPVIIAKKFGAPAVVDDGVTIAKELVLEDPYENIGIQMVREAALKTNEAAGDGTSTCTVLTQALFNAGLKNIAAGADPVFIRSGIKKAEAAIVAHLKEMSIPVKNQKDVENIASISANDEAVGSLIAEALEKVGSDGIISVEEGRTSKTELEVVGGMQFDHGYVSPYFVNNSEKMECVLENPLILFANKKITAMSDLVGIIQSVAKAGRSLLVISDGIEGEPLSTLILNSVRGSLKVCAVRAPGFGDRVKELMQDIAILTGGTVIDEATGMRLESATLAMLGAAKRVVVTRDNTTIINGSGKKEAVDDRKLQLKTMMDNADDDFNKQRLRERLAKLSGGVAVIRVGAATEPEMIAKKYKVEDAKNAAVASISEGILPGGGLALYRTAKHLKDIVNSDIPDEQCGINLVFDAIEQPMKIIAENSGINGDTLLYQIETPNDSSDNDYIGFNGKRKVICNLIDAGIVDPCKVTRCALENAVSIACTLLTAGCIITDKPEKDGTVRC